MSTVIVGMSTMTASSNHTDALLTLSLGSCLAVTMYDPENQVGGLIHCMLPDSGIHADKAKESPGMFVDTGIPELIRRIEASGGKQDNLVIKAAGAASMMIDTDAFRIGERNFEALKKALESINLSISASDIGGHRSRNMNLDIETGRVCVICINKETYI